MAAYYNENEPKTAAWLRKLIKSGLIADGEVDTRSIVDVQPSDLTGFVQCHFFAGIGGWSYALRLAGWPDDRAVWTGSCPCQPWSVSGARRGASDGRDLWPAWFDLIRKRLPLRVFGEQVESPDGRWWLDRVFDDMESLEYAIGAADLPASSVGAPHERQRLWFVADAAGTHGRWRPEMAKGPSQKLRGSGQIVRHVAWPDGRGSRSTLAVADVLSPSYGVSGRMGRLRGYGNAIVPQVAAEVIAAYMEVCEDGIR